MHLSVSVHKNNTRTYTVGIGLVELYMSFLKIATSVGVLSFLMLSSFTIMGFVLTGWALMVWLNRK